MDGFLESSAEYFNQGDKYSLSDLFNPLAQDDFQLELQNDLLMHPNFRLTTFVDRAMSLTRNKALSEFLAHYLVFVRDAQLHEEGDAVKACELMVLVYKAALVVFQQPDAGWFAQTLRKLTGPLVTLSFLADDQNGDKKMEITNQNAPQFIRAIQLAINERNSDPNAHFTEKEAAFSIANGIFRICFKLDNFTLCDTVIISATKAYDVLDTDFVLKADRVKYYYYLGRLALYQRNLRKAMMNLRKSFDLCTGPEHNIQRQQILVFLIPTCLLLGLTLDFGCLQMFQLDEQYLDLFAAVKCGNYKAALKAIEKWRTWHVRNRTYLLLREKLEILCWRNLTRNIVTTLDPGHTVNRLELKYLVDPANAFIDEEEALEIDDVECMVAVLIEQGYIKAYIHHNNRLLVLQKGPQFGFPSLSTVRSVVVSE
ncbi:hypothetical protein BT69DRAFT_1146888 [Atractiella rhizophila]|nr:hypothetical protein BT69DRAFT_1146888 [Atractiella rhizophila]